jgi:WD40 repeat protein
LNFLLAITDDKELSVYNSASFNKKDNWVSSGHNAIMLARWISDTRILAGYATPGELLFFSLGNPKPIGRITPPGLAECWIKDFDFSSDRNFAYCGTHSITKMVFKVAVHKSKDDNQFKWNHQYHEGSVESVRLSPDQTLVLSGDNRRTLLLSSSKDGSFFGKYTGLSDMVKGLIWFPNSLRILVCTYKGIAFFDTVGTKRVSLKKITEIGIMKNCGLRPFTG